MLAGLGYALYYVAITANDEFKENGLAKVANITKLYSKREVKTHGKGSWETNYYADISFFIKESDTRTGEKEVVEEEEPQKKKTLDEIIASIDIGKVEIGDYTTASLKLSKEKFEELQGQEKVEILYLKDNPERVILRELVEK